MRACCCSLEFRSACSW
ncbi:hypothetical protein HaLaN_18559, partial [Haematococcus lacustris]